MTPKTLNATESQAGLLLQGGGSNKRVDITYAKIAILLEQGESLSDIKSNLNDLISLFFKGPAPVRIKKLSITNR